jgi:hypothetical protein
VRGKKKGLFLFSSLNGWRQGFKNRFRIFVGLLAGS